MSTLDKKALFALNDIKTVTEVVPEWGGMAVTIKAMDGEERDTWDAYNAERQLEAQANKKIIIDNKGLKARLLVLTIVDGKGKRVFDESDIPMLQKKNGAVIDRLAEIAGRLAGIRSVDERQAEKNSKTPTSDSGSN